MFFLRDEGEMPNLSKRHILLLSMVVGLAWFGMPTDATAQSKPGVIDRDGDEDGDQKEDDDGQQNQDDDDRKKQGSQGNQGSQNGQKVITPDNVDPYEEYNLPPNFDPDYRPKRTPRNVRVSIDFRQASLEEVVKFFSGAMNMNFIISDSLQANKTITIISPEKVTLNQAFRAFQAALEMNGLTLVKSGDFWKIVQSSQAITEPMGTYEQGERLPNEARMVTAIVPIKNTAPDEMKNVVSNFTTKAASIIPYGNNLIITENAANLRRVRRLITRLDEGDAANKVFVYQVQYADATQIKDKLTEIFEAEQQGRRGNKKGQAAEGAEAGELDVQVQQIIADERTNKLIVVTSPRSFDKIEQMIELLDAPTAVGGQVHVKFLEYADAEELASTLSNLASSTQQNAGRGGSSAAARARAARARRAGGEDGGGGGEVAALLQGEVNITAYKPNNALIVTAAPKDFIALEQVIEELDRPRKQVYVEAVIMEISLDTDRQLGVGVSAATGQDYDGVLPDSAEESGLIDDTSGGIVGQSNYGGLGSLLSILTGGSVAGSIGLVGPIATLPGTEISLPAFALTLQATQTDRSVNLLSAPAVLTMDNEEAEIVVADREPFVRGLGGGGLGGLGSAAGLLGGAGGAGNNAASGIAGGLGSALGGLGGLGVSPVEYEDVGITLRILPQVNESNYVRLEIDQEVSDIKGASNLSDNIPTRTKRSVKSVVLVEDQSTIVIGGLMKERETETVTKIPFLGDIPLLGVLFRNTGKKQIKQNLVLMLTPYIIESKADVQKIYERKMEEREELAKLLSIQRKEYIKNVNFQKKSGLIERMRQHLSKAEQKEKARKEAMEAFDEDGKRYQILGAQEPEPAQPEGDAEQAPAENQNEDGGEESSEDTEE
jgi:general secretion pathway protein D